MKYVEKEWKHYTLKTVRNMNKKGRKKRRKMYMKRKDQEELSYSYNLNYSNFRVQQQRPRLEEK